MAKLIFMVECSSCMYACTHINMVHVAAVQAYLEISSMGERISSSEFILFFALILYKKTITPPFALERKVKLIGKPHSQVSPQS